MSHQTPQDQQLAHFAADDQIALMDMLLKEHNITWPQLIASAGVDFLTAARIMRKGDFDDPQWSYVVAALFKPLGMTPEQATNLVSQYKRVTDSLDKERRRVNLLVNRFIISKRPPHHHRDPLRNYCCNLVGSRPTNTVAIAARPSLPRKVMDIAHIYHKLLDQNFFGNETWEPTR